MLKIRISISLVISVLTLMTTYQFVYARTEDTSNPPIAPVIVNSNPGVSPKPLAVPGPPFPAPAVKCVYIPGVVGSIVACPNPSQIPAIVNNDPGGSANQVKVESMSAIRPADSYSAQLSLLEQRAHEVSRFDQASSYALRLENLAQMGRAASTANHPPVSADAYASYLDSLRRLGQAVDAKQSGSTDANGYTRWLDDLRRMAFK